MTDNDLLNYTSANLRECVFNNMENFTVEKLIGKGQFSCVYKASVKNGEPRVVALKKIQIFDMVDVKARLDCMKEINLLQVRIYI